MNCYALYDIFEHNYGNVFLDNSWRDVFQLFKFNKKDKLVFL